MSTTDRPSPRPRTSDNKLYQACLDLCIKGIGQLKVSKRVERATSAAHTDNNDNTHVTRAAASRPLPASSATEQQQSVPIPPPLPSPPPSPPASPAAFGMDRSLLHGAPPRGPSGSPSGFRPSGYGSQDARSNLAVQPAATPTKINLKKAAVKVVRPAEVARPAGPAPAASITGPVRSAPKVEDGHESLKPAPKADAKAVPAKAKPAAPNDNAESAIDSIFTRLMSPSPAPSPAATPTPMPVGHHRTAGPSSPVTTTTTPDGRGRAAAGPDKSFFSFEDEPTNNLQTQFLKNYVANIGREEPKTRSLAPASATPPVVEVEGAEELKMPSNATVEPKAAVNPCEGMSKEDLERRYLQKAAEYLTSVPIDGKAITADLVKNVMIKLRHSYSATTKPDAEAIDDLKSKYLGAVVSYINGLGKRGATPITADFIEQNLETNDGDFLHLCATLVDEKVLVIENLDEVARLCEAIMGVLPNEEAKAATASPETKLISNDPMDKMTAWPTQEKRENAAACRTCVLKGVSGITSLNQLQALVWGGRLESISLPEPGSGFALVKFLTPEACQKYFKATENGIEISGEKKAVIFVEKQPGPNSINDVIRNCIEGDASRCVRAYDADEDWSDMALLKLARGKGQLKREVDRIKRGKTAKGRYYIEFRFASIYHALNFKRALMDDEDWEHCTIGYAPDPCETASGVHFKDEDEEGGGFFA